MLKQQKKWRIFFAVIAIIILLFWIYADFFLGNSSPMKTLAFLGIITMIVIMYFINLKSDPRYATFVSLFIICVMDGQLWLPSFLRPYRGLIFFLIFLMSIVMLIKIVELHLVHFWKIQKLG